MGAQNSKQGLGQLQSQVTPLQSIGNNQSQDQKNGNNQSQDQKIGMISGGGLSIQKAVQQASQQASQNESNALQLQSKDEFSVIFYSQPAFQGNQTVVKVGQTNVLVGVIGSFTMGKNVNVSFNSSPCLKDKDGNPLEWRYGFANSPQYVPVKDKLKYSIDLTKVTEAPMYAHVTLHLPNPKCACSYAPEVSSFENVDDSYNSYYILIFAIILLIAFLNRERLMKMIKG